MREKRVKEGKSFKWIWRLKNSYYDERIDFIVCMIDEVIYCFF